MARKKIELSAPDRSNVIDMKTGLPVSKTVLPVICERIHFYRDRSGMEQKKLAEFVGVTPNSVSNWENGRSRPDVNLLPAICTALDITLYDLFALDAPTIPYTSRQQKMLESYDRLSTGHRHAVDILVQTLTDVELEEKCPNLKTVAFFSRRLAAGIGDPSEFEDEGEPVYLYATPETERADCIFVVNGDSMEPAFQSGQEVLVQRIPGSPDLQYGEIGAFIVGNETYIKEYQEDGLHSLNPDYEPIHFCDTDSVYLIGRVLGVLDHAMYAGASEIALYESIHGEESSSKRS